MTAYFVYNKGDKPFEVTEDAAIAENRSIPHCYETDKAGNALVVAPVGKKVEETPKEEVPVDEVPEEAPKPKVSKKKKK